MKNIYKVERNATIVQYGHVFADSPEEARTEAEHNPQSILWLESSVNDPIVVDVKELP